MLIRPTGSTGLPVANAIRATPVLPCRAGRRAARVPSGKMPITPPSAKMSSIEPRAGCTGASPGSVDRCLPDGSQEPATNRPLSDLPMNSSFFAGNVILGLTMAGSQGVARIQVVGGQDAAVGGYLLGALDLDPEPSCDDRTHQGRLENAVPHGHRKIPPGCSSPHHSRVPWTDLRTRKAPARRNRFAASHVDLGWSGWEGDHDRRWRGLSRSGRPVGPTPGGAGVLVCHGFSGTPASVRDWALHLADLGAAVAARCCPAMAPRGSRWR